MSKDRDDFDLMIGRLDRILSEMVTSGRSHEGMDYPDIQTLKHHAEDMMLAGKKILKDLGYDEPKTDQPRVSLSPDTPCCAGCGTLWLDTTAIGSTVRGYVPNCQCKKTGILIGAER